MKNVLKVIVFLVIFILGIILIDELFVDDKKVSEDKKEVEKIDFRFMFLIDNLIQDYEVVEFSEEEKTAINKLLSELNYSKVDVKLSFIGDYKLIFNEYELIFDNNSDPYGLLIKGESHYIINVKQLKETVLNYVDKKDILKVYLYHRGDVSTINFKRINLSEEDRKELFNVVNDIKELQPHEYVDLTILGEYYLIVDNTILYFDDFPGYIMKNNKMAYMSDEFTAILSKYINSDGPILNECCSCCPDLKPGEACIDMCCPCN